MDADETGRKYAEAVKQAVGLTGRTDWPRQGGRQVSRTWYGTTSGIPITGTRFQGLFRLAVQLRAAYYRISHISTQTLL